MSGRVEGLLRAFVMRHPATRPLARVVKQSLGRVARLVGVAPRRISPAVAPVSAGVPDMAVPEGSGITAVELHACTLFYSYLRLRGIAGVERARWRSDAAIRAAFVARVRVADALPQQKCEVLTVHADGSVEFALEALVDRAHPPAAMVVELGFDGPMRPFPLQVLLPAAQLRDLRTLMPDFQQATRDLAASAGRRPRLLDLGGRARSRNQLSEYFPDCDVTVFDIVAADEVDVVGDAHELGRHFPPETFDFVMSISVFEHLLMPWKVAIELGRVMRTGGIAMVHTHQTEGMHDTPWDFLRFSDTAWSGIFNRYTGFEVIKADLSRYLHVIPAVILEPVGDMENAGGFQCSTVLVRKTGPALVEWPVPLGEVVKSSYPQGPAAHVPG